MARRGGRPAPKSNPEVYKSVVGAVDCIEYNLKNPGRPSKWHDGFVRMVEKYVLIGSIDEGIADLLGVTETTLNEWKSKSHPELTLAIKRARKNADQDVINALRHRALGYSHRAVKIFNDEGRAMTVPYTEHYPPSEIAAFFWLKNRDPDNWRDKPLDSGGESPNDLRRMMRESLSQIEDSVPTKKDR